MRKLFNHHVAGITSTIRARPVRSVCLLSLNAEGSQAFPSSIILDVNPISILTRNSCNPIACLMPSIFPRRSNPKSPSLLRQQLPPRLTASLSLLVIQITSRLSLGMGLSVRFATICSAVSPPMSHTFASASPENRSKPVSPLLTSRPGAASLQACGRK